MSRRTAIADKKILLYFAPVALSTPAQRAHAFASIASKERNWEVHWIDPPPGRLPRASDFRALFAEENACDDTLQFRRHTPALLPIEPVPVLRELNAHRINRLLDGFETEIERARESKIVVGRPSRLALTACRRWPESCLAYDAMDDFPAFFSGISRWHTQVVEKALCRCVPNIMVSSEALTNKFAQSAKQLFYVPNACDARRFRDIAKRRRRSVIGYVGTIGHWFDWNVLIHAARQRPHYEFRIFGRIFSRQSGSRLPKNVALQGEVDHSRAIEAMQEFDLGLIPFKQNELTAAVDPVKYYEYRASGLPVVSSAFGEMRRHEDGQSVFTYDSPDGVAEALDKAMQVQVSEAGTREFRLRNDWRARFGDLFAKLL